MDLSTVTLDLEKMLRRLVPSRIGFQVTGHSQPVVVKADSGQLHQVIVNLVVNAGDAIDGTGSIGVSVDVVELSEDDAAQYPEHVSAGEYARLSVEDTGVGIPPDVLDQVFEPFFTTKEEGQGTGLGLATVYGIVEQSGGHVLIDSNQGEGTTVQVLLPTQFGAVDRDPGRSVPTDVPTTKRATILLVEDNDAVRGVARRTLDRAGHVVVEAANGREALDLAQQPIDLVFSDVIMPHIGGVELRRRLLDERPDLKVILTSGHSEDEVQAETRQRGTAFIAKPYSPRELLRCVSDVLADPG